MAIWKRRERLPAPVAAPPEREPPPPAAEFLTASATVRTSLGADSVVNGRLSFSSPTRIDGTLRGEVRTTELLIVGEGGYVEGTIRAAHLVVLGNVQGNVVGAEHVEIGPHARVQGTVEARLLVVREGGTLNGDCRIGPPRPNVHVLPGRSGAAAPEASAAQKGKD